MVALAAEKRWNYESIDSSCSLSKSREILLEDFDFRPNGFQQDEDDATKHPVPFPEVLSLLKELSAQKNLVKEGMLLCSSCFSLISIIYAISLR